ncbi:hypothetical protein GOHSU_56_00010, partial [Gordonia hirsuta DSM 44140 = NBRC 16056]
TLPSRRSQTAPVPAGTPRYRQIPRWGLQDRPPTAAANDADAPGAREAALAWMLRWTWRVLVGATAVQLLRYLLLMANRSRPIPYWLDLTTLTLIWLAGLAVLGVALGALYFFAGWICQVRARSYAAAGWREPRPRWSVIALAVVPYLNVLGAPLLLWEAAAAVGGAQAERARRMITRAAVAWGLVSAVGLVALVYRIFSVWVSDSIQTGADAMVWTLVALIASASFVRWLNPRLSALTATAAVQTGAPRRRLVVAP